MSATPQDLIASVRGGLRPLEAQRLAMLAASRREYATGGVAIAIGLLGGFLLLSNQGGGVVAGLIILVPCLVAGALFINRASNRRRSFLHQAKLRLMGGLLDAIQPDLAYDPQRGISRELFSTARLFSHSADRYAAEDLIRGRVGQTDIMLSEVHAEYRSTSTDSKGRSRTTYHTFFRGLFVMADFHKHFAGTLRVLPGQRGLLGGIGRALAGFRPFSHEKLVRLEDAEFDEAFMVFGSDDVEARYILSPSMMRRILEIRLRWNDEVRLSFFQSSVCLAISHPNNLFDPSIHRPVDCQNQLARIASEIRACLDLVEDLNLNTRIWSKE